jgi:hypothetical protein
MRAAVMLEAAAGDRITGDSPQRRTSTVGSRLHRPLPQRSPRHGGDFSDNHAQRARARAASAVVTRQREAVWQDPTAVERNGDLAHLRAIDHRTQRAADQSLDFLRAARSLAACRFALVACVRRARQHAVFRRHPALAGVAHERRHAACHAGGTEHLGIAHADQARSFGMAREAGCQ